MNTFMTVDEVFANFPDEWVLLDELDSQDNLSVQGGRVIGHNAERSPIEAMAIEMQLPRCVIVCTKQKDGKDAHSRDYAVSPITSGEEIASFLTQNA